jgi:hypothetical protein
LFAWGTAVFRRRGNRVPGRGGAPVRHTVLVY